MSNLLSFTSVTAANGTVSIRPDFYGSGITYNGKISVHVVGACSSADDNLMLFSFMQ